MGFGFRKSIKIAPGIRLNVSHRGVGASVGVKGLRYSANTYSGSRVSASIPGTGIYYSTAVGTRQYKTNAYSKRSELRKMEKELQKMEELAQAKYEVDVFENQLEMIKSIHKECDMEFDWARIKTYPAPFNKGEMGPKEKEALRKVQDYKSGFFKKLFGTAEKERLLLEKQVEEAKKEDISDYESWEKLIATATKISNGDIDEYIEVIKELAPLDDLSDFGSGFEINVEHPDYVEVEFDVQSSDIIPSVQKSLTKTGKLSVKEMPKSRFYELYQDYVCSCVLRIARDMFAILPIKHIYIHAMDEWLDSSTGVNRKDTILSVKIDRATLQSLNFDLIDCSDSMINFQHHMKFNKTKGFQPVEKIFSGE
ncbi:DUF4236 domain-containing protein [Brevibacillus borstelensis]|uniref:DUF4236 domain-containing protein n=1 Tax=Brevibacillus borstelensis TaxID=45462 RepID=UPI00203FE4BE|nr:DUF4236 domain-containing protein [Brevibacillus borstelensis]MCM3624812.1 DUF4236 domain-containing protein [Brevibacillus borstelensis]